MNDMQLEFKDGNNKIYKVNNIWDSVVYIKKTNRAIIMAELSSFVEKLS